MEAAQALRELMELSSQIEAAAVLGDDGAVVASSPEGDEPAGSLATAALQLMGAAFDLGSGQEVGRVEVELEEGALFVVREGAHTIVARTGSEPTAGLVVYDLRTSLRSIDEPTPKKRRSSRPKKDDA